MLGIVPARKGSKGIPGKNLYPLNGKPLIEYTIEAIKESDLSHYIISTDDEEIMKKYGDKALIIKRPLYLAQDDTPMAPVIKHALLTYEKMIDIKFDAVMTLQPTSPLRNADDINVCINKYLRMKDSFHCVASMYNGIHPIKSYGKINGDECGPFIKQDMPYDKHKHRCITRNGAIFVTSRLMLMEQGRLFDDWPWSYIMPKSRSIDIDDMDDMFMAEAILKHREATR